MAPEVFIVSNISNLRLNYSLSAPSGQRSIQQRKCKTSWLRDLVQENSTLQHEITWTDSRGIPSTVCGLGSTSNPTSNTYSQVKKKKQNSTQVFGSERGKYFAVVIVS